MIPVAHGDAAGVYVPYMLPGQHARILAGREIYGFPKQDAEIELSEGEDTIAVRVSRRGRNSSEPRCNWRARIKPVPTRPSLPGTTRSLSLRQARRPA